MALSNGSKLNGPASSRRGFVLARLLRRHTALVVLPALLWVGGAIAEELEREPTAASTRDGGEIKRDKPPRLLPRPSDRVKEEARTDPRAPRADAIAEPSAPAGPQPQVTAFTQFEDLSENPVDSPCPQAGICDPPDPTLGKSFNRVLLGANRFLRLHNATGSLIQTRGLNSFFNAPTADGQLFDPKVYFDRNGAQQRFYVVALQQTGNSNATGKSFIWLAISRSADPTQIEPPSAGSTNSANWCRYKINGKRNVDLDGNAGTDDSTWSDFPGLGVGADKLVLTFNEFRFTNDSFTFAVVRVFNKLVAANNAASCPTEAAITDAVVRPAATPGDSGTFTLQPGQHYTSPSSFAGTSNPVYLVRSLAGATSTNYKVFRVRNLGPAVVDPFVFVGANSYGPPPNAPQPGTSVPIDSGDARVTQVAGIGDAITAVHATTCQVGSGANESCVRVVKFNVGQNAGGALTATLAQQQTFGGNANDFFYMPGVAVNNAEQTALVFLRSSTTSPLAPFWSLKNSADATFPAPTVIKAGNCSLNATLNDTRARSGDYAGAQSDPSDVTSFWLTSERAQQVGASCLWAMRYIKLVP